MKEVDVQKSVQRLYFDLSGNPAPHLLDWLLTITLPDHILYGSDFPFTPSAQIKNNLNALLKMLDQPELASYKSRILYRNAKILFHL